MKSLFKTAVLLCVLFTIGCASGPKYAEVAQTIPELSSDQGRIFIYRNSMLGAAITPDVKLNGEGNRFVCGQRLLFCRQSTGNL
jgi:hypothetical protein